MSNIKIDKAKGKMIFIEPSNVIGIEPYNSIGKQNAYRIIVKHPYSADSYHYAYDENGYIMRDANGEYIKQYSYPMWFLDRIN